MTTKQDIINEMEELVADGLLHPDYRADLINMINDLKPQVKKLELVDCESDFKYVTSDGMYKILLDEDLNQWDCYFLEDGFDTTDTVDEAILAAQKHHEQCILGQLICE